MNVTPTDIVLLCPFIGYPVWPCDEKYCHSQNGQNGHFGYNDNFCDGKLQLKHGHSVIQLKSIKLSIFLFI